MIIGWTMQGCACATMPGGGLVLGLRGGRRKGKGIMTLRVAYHGHRLGVAPRAHPAGEGTSTDGTHPRTHSNPTCRIVYGDQVGH